MSALKYVEAGPEDVQRISEYHRFGDLQLLRHEYWTYLADRSVFFMALDGDKIVGTQAFTPFELNVNGRVILTGRSERTMVSPEHRGGDVFANLMNNCVRVGTEKGHTFFWGFSTGATKAFERSGFIHLTGHREYLLASVGPQPLASYLLSRDRSLSLRPADAINAVRTNRTEALAYAKVALSPLSIASRIPAAVAGALRRSSGMEIVRKPKNYADFDGLYARLKGKEHLVHLTHGAALHDWALEGGNHPVEWFFGYRQGELVAYACLELTDSITASLIDFAAVESGPFLEILEEVRQAAERAKRVFLSAICNPRCMGQKALFPTFHSAGYISAFRGGNTVIRPGTYIDMRILGKAAPLYLTDLWGLSYRTIQ